MANMMWSSLPSGLPAFHVFRRDDAVVRTLQGSQVAVHEYRMAYDNLLAAAMHERDHWERDKTNLEDELRALAIRKAEAERRMKEQYSALHAGLRASEDALSKLDAEHHLLQQSSEETASNLIQRVDSLQRTVADLQAESRSLQSELASVHSDAALKDVAMQQVADLEAAMMALQDRAKHLVKDLELEKAAADRHIVELSSDLAATQQQLVQESVARVSSNDTALRLAVERQQLLAALQLERLINEPLRNTHYATTTTLSHVMRSPVASAVKERAAYPHPQQQQPGSPGGYISTGRPGSAPSGAAAPLPLAGAAGQDMAVSLTFSPQLAATALSRSGPTGLVTGRNLTRLGRSWATTSGTAGLPNPTYLDNIHSPISPPPPGPPRRAAAASALPYNSSASPQPYAKQAAVGGGGRGLSAAAAAAAAGSGVGPGAKPAGHHYLLPQYLTTLLRSPQSPEAAGEGWQVAGGSDSPSSPAYRGEPTTPTRMTAPRTGRPAMRSAIKSGWEDSAAAAAKGIPSTLVYG